jgi:hypothetical protein
MFRLLVSAILIPLCVQADNTYRLEVFGAASKEMWNPKSVFNPTNRTLHVPSELLSVEVRPDIEVQLGEKHSMVWRSRHFGRLYREELKSPDEQRLRTDDPDDIPNFFLSSAWNDELSTTLGLQNYQWGPAEIASPSNPFYHFLNNQRSFFFIEKGRFLLRANWNPDPNSNHWSVVGMLEPENNRTRFWMADQKFKPRSAIKVEYQFENPANSVAWVGGQTDAQRGFFGEYFNWSPIEGQSLYGDLKHQMGRTNWVPVQDSFGFMNMERALDRRVYTLAVFGYRWEGRVDFRQEFIWNEAGFSRAEWNKAMMASTALSPQILANARRFALPGLEFRTRSYSYTSLRVPDLGRSKKAAAAVRWLTALEHDSSVLQLNFEYNLNDHMVITGEMLYFLGLPNKEFRLVSDSQQSLGFRWSY